MATFSKKVCLLGDFAVGKTSLVRRFVYNLFSDKYLSTIGVNVSRKTVAVQQADDVAELTMMLWDLAANAEFDQMQASYLRGAAGAIVVCDLTRPETLSSVKTHAQNLRDTSAKAHLILAANKADLVDQHQVTPAEVEAVAAALEVPFYFTSAKNGTQVEDIFRHLGRLLLA
ncbi:MAG: Rab family GTPase [Anaerolineae bacterium]